MPSNCLIQELIFRSETAIGQTHTIGGIVGWLEDENDIPSPLESANVNKHLFHDPMSLSGTDFKLAESAKKGGGQSDSSCLTTRTSRPLHHSAHRLVSLYASSTVFEVTFLATTAKLCAFILKGTLSERHSMGSALPLPGTLGSERQRRINNGAAKLSCFWLHPLSTSYASLCWPQWLSCGSSLRRLETKSTNQSHPKSGAVHQRRRQ